MQSDRGLGLEEKRQCSSAQRLVAGSCYTISAPQLSDTAPVLPYTALYWPILCSTVLQLQIAPCFCPGGFI